MATTSKGVKAAARAAFAAWAATIAAPALSLGLGEIEMQSFLNEPLRAEVALLDTRELTVDDVRIRLAGVDDFDRLGVDRSFFLTSIEFEVTVDPATGRGAIVLTTPEAVLEPFLDIIIEARWPQGRVLREYTILVDPPAFRKEILTVSATERLESPAPDKRAMAEPEDSGPTRREEQRDRGDRVAVRESSLPAGEMPQRAFSAETAPEPRAGSRYMVRRDETLWEIASSGRPDGVSVQQAMLDIQSVNPEAFINGNINRVKAGYIIYLPAAGEVNSADLASALEEVRAQNRAFEEGVGAPGVTAAATLRVSADSAPVSQGAQDELPTLVPAEDVGLSQETDAPATDALASSAGTPETETPAAADSELAAQLAAMSERLDTLEQIVALKDQQIATLEEALREAREAAAAAPQVVSPVPEQTTAAAPAPRPQPQPQRSEPPAAGIPWLPVGGGLAVLLLLGAALYLRRRGAAASSADSRAASGAGNDDVFQGVSLKSDALDEPTDDGDDIAAPIAATAAALASRRSADDGTATAPDADLGVSEEESAPDATADRGPGALDAGGSRGYGERKHDDYIDEAATGDALAEADIYIAYGRYLQAIELLNTAIESEPDNSAYRLKLTELYVDMGEEESAATQLLALRVQGDEEAIERAEALLGGATPVASSPATAEPAPESTTAADELAADDDFGLDLDLDDEATADEPSVDPDTLELERSIAEGGFSAPDAGAPDSDAAADPSEFSGDAASAGPGDEAAPDFDDGIEFERLEIEDDIVDATADDTPLSLEDPEEILDLTDALSEFRAPEGGNGDDSGAPEDLMIADDADQMATKLDLARAYIDMGDGEGARGILEEVAAAGSGAQQQEARELLERIG